MSKLKSYKSENGKELLVEDIDTSEIFAGEWIESLYNNKDYITLGYFEDEKPNTYKSGNIQKESLKHNLCIFGKYHRMRILDSVLLQLIYSNESIVHFDTRNMNRLIEQIPKDRLKDVTRITVNDSIPDFNELNLSENPIVFILVEDKQYNIFNSKVDNILNYAKNNLDNKIYISLNKSDNYIFNENSDFIDTLKNKNHDTDARFILSNKTPRKFPENIQLQLNQIKHHVTTNPGGNPNDAQEIALLIGGNEDCSAWEVSDIGTGKLMGKFLVDNHLSNPKNINMLPRLQPKRNHHTTDIKEYTN